LAIPPVPVGGGNSSSGTVIDEPSTPFQSPHGGRFCCRASHTLEATRLSPDASPLHAASGKRTVVPSTDQPVSASRSSGTKQPQSPQIPSFGVEIAKFSFAGSSPFALEPSRLSVHVFASSPRSAAATFSAKHGAVSKQVPLPSAFPPP